MTSLEDTKNDATLQALIYSERDSKNGISEKPRLIKAWLSTQTSSMAKVSEN